MSDKDYDKGFRDGMANPGAERMLPPDNAPRAVRDYADGFAFGQECAQPSTICHTCGNPAHTPRKRISGGKIVEQCVDMIHDAHVYAGAPSESAFFLSRAIKAFKRAGLRRCCTGNMPV